MCKKIEFEATALVCGRAVEPHLAKIEVDLRNLSTEEVLMVENRKRYRVTLEPVEPGPRPCPFCGAKPELVIGFSTDGRAYRCVNANCPVKPRSGRIYDSKADAIRAWNRRDGCA